MPGALQMQPEELGEPSTARPAVAETAGAAGAAHFEAKT
jgi:hypothetical protein